jgi:putative heme-binding domain-containing protein
MNAVVSPNSVGSAHSVASAVRMILRSWPVAAIAAVMATAALAAQETPPSVDAQDGQRAYLGACTNCHGPDGNSVPGVDLAHGQFRHASTDDELVEIIRRGIPGTAMPPGNYSPVQAARIVAYLRWLAASGRSATATGDPARGRALFEGKGQCLTCHQVRGKGSQLGPDLTDVGRMRRVAELERALLDPEKEVQPQNRTVKVVARDGSTVTGRLLHHDTFTVLVLDTNEQLRAFSKSDVRDVSIVKTSTKTSYRGRLTPEEIADLVGYLASLRG